MVIVPNVLRDYINAKLDEAFKEVPGAKKDRDVLFHELLEYYDENGTLPDFRLAPVHGQG